jgi:hypothetical protein
VTVHSSGRARRKLQQGRPGSDRIAWTNNNGNENTAGVRSVNGNSNANANGNANHNANGNANRNKNNNR